jgi:hypothetical protein
MAVLLQSSTQEVPVGLAGRVEAAAAAGVAATTAAAEVVEAAKAKVTGWAPLPARRAAAGQPPAVVPRGPTMAELLLEPGAAVSADTSKQPGRYPGCLVDGRRAKVEAR